MRIRCVALIYIVMSWGPAITAAHGQGVAASPSALRGIAMRSATGCPASGVHHAPIAQWAWVGASGVRAISRWDGARATLVVGAVPPGYVQKVLWQTPKSFDSVVHLSGHNVRTGKPIRFRFASQGKGSQPVGTTARLDPRYPNALGFGARGRSWVGYSSEVLLPSLGCFALRAAWDGGGWTVIFSAVAAA